MKKRERALTISRAQRVGAAPKSSNRLYRLNTDQGSFAVKELNLVDRRWTYHADDVFRFEQAAFAADIPMPEPISAGPDVLVHRWVEGDKLPEAPVPAAFAFEIGEILARALPGRRRAAGRSRSRDGP